MRFRFPFGGRPSPAIAISLVALFVSLGGVGYAAVSLPNNSVGTAQLKNNAVTNSKLKDNSVSYTKIVPGSVGIVRANTGQLQVRVSGKCGPNSGIGSINQSGGVSCNSSLPPQTGVVNTANVSNTLTPVNTLSLQGPGSYLVFANPTATVISNTTSRQVTVSCTLTVGSATQTRSATINTAGFTVNSASIPLQLAGFSGNSGVSCTSSVAATPAASVNVTSSLNAIRTS